MVTKKEFGIAIIVIAICQLVSAIAIYRLAFLMNEQAEINWGFVELHRTTTRNMGEVINIVEKIVNRK